MSASGTDGSAGSDSPAAGLLDRLPSEVDITPGHVAFRRTIRAFVDKYLDAATIDECERAGGVPPALLQASYAAGIYAMRAPTELGGTPPTVNGVAVRADPYYEWILVDELSACGAHGMVLELVGNFSMLLPLLHHFADEQLKQEIVEPMVRAKLFACVAFTEPPPPPETKAKAPQPKASRQAAGGPTAPRPRGPFGPRMRTTATPCENGEYEVTGEKMYISFAARSDYIACVCNVKRPSADGGESTPNLSLVLIPSRLPGVTITPMYMQGWLSTSTCRVTFKSVRVPGRLLLADGSKSASSSGDLSRLLLSLLHANVTQERFFNALMSHRSARVCLEDAITFARAKRIDRGQRLIDSSATRYELVRMATRIQQNQGLLESLTRHMSREEAANEAASPSAPLQAPIRSPPLVQQIALAKYACTRALTDCAQSAAVICSAAAVARGTGPGARIERLMRDAALATTAGGGENTMIEFVAKKAKL